MDGLSENLNRTSVIIKIKNDTSHEAPLGKRNRETDEFWTPPVLKKGRPKKSEQLIVKDEKSVGKTEKVICSLCEEEMTCYKFTTHNAKDHIGLAVRKGQPPINLDDYNSVLAAVRQAFRIIKAAKCQKCGDVKKSFVGFTSHFMRCGRDEEVESQYATCEDCGAKVLQCSLYAHIKYTHNKKEVTEVVFEGKRQSAIRATEKMQTFLRDEEPADLQKDFKKIQKGKKISKVPKIIKEKFENDFGKNGNVNCPHNCGASFETKASLLKHYFGCQTLPDEFFYCDNCWFITADRENMKNHVKCDQEDHEFENDPESDDSEIEDDGKKEKIERGGKKGSERMIFESSRLKSYAYKNGIKKQRIDLLNGHAFREKLEKELFWSRNKIQIHFDTVLEDWRLVADLRFLEKFKLARDVVFQEESKKTDMKFKLFESEVVNGTLTFLVGGSIRGISWSPIHPARSAHKETRQYLAVLASNCDNEDIFLHKPHEDVGSLIQIWDVGPLNFTSALEKPIMRYGIFLPRITLWSLTWSSRDHSLFEATSYLPRIGYLAATGFDGLVRIYSMPQPETFLKSFEKTALPIFTVEPILILQQDIPESGKCLSISWNDFDTIAAGFENGSVALWKFTQDGLKFLKNKTLRPFLSIQASTNHIISVALSSLNPRLLLAGASPKFSVWDLTDPTEPLEMIQGAHDIGHNAVWSSIYPVIAVFKDQLLSIRRPFPEIAKNSITLIAPLNTLFTNFSMNEWTFMPLVATASGEVAAVAVPVPIAGDFVFRPKNNFLNENFVLSRTLVENESSEKLVFKDFSKKENSLLDVPISDISVLSVNKVLWNPNFSSFLYFAVGYQCGFVRILRFDPIWASAAREVESVLQSHELFK